MVITIVFPRLSSTIAQITPIKRADGLGELNNGNSRLILHRQDVEQLGEIQMEM